MNSMLIELGKWISVLFFFYDVMYVFGYDGMWLNCNFFIFLVLVIIELYKKLVDEKELCGLKSFCRIL